MLALRRFGMSSAPARFWKVSASERRQGGPTKCWSICCGISARGTSTKQSSMWQIGIGLDRANVRSDHLQGTFPRESRMVEAFERFPSELACHHRLTMRGR